MRNEEGGVRAGSGPRCLRARKMPEADSVVVLEMATVRLACAVPFRESVALGCK